MQVRLHLAAQEKTPVVCRQRELLAKRRCPVHHMFQSACLHLCAVCPVPPPPPICVPVPLNTSNKALIPEGPQSRRLSRLLPSPQRSIVLHLELVIVTLRDKWDDGYCRLWVARQHYPQVHWVISFFFLPFLCNSSISVLPSISEVSSQHED